MQVAARRITAAAASAATTTAVLRTTTRTSSSTIKITTRIRRRRRLHDVLQLRRPPAAGGAASSSCSSSCTAAAATAFLSLSYYYYYYYAQQPQAQLVVNNRTPTTQCEEQEKAKPSSSPSSPLSSTGKTKPTTATTPKSISRLRRTLWYLRLRNLPLPRLITKNDPDLTLSPRRLRARQNDERTVRELRRRIVLEQQRQIAAGTTKRNTTADQAKAEAREKIGSLIRRTYETLYGPKVTPYQRQMFLEKYGCTGYTDDILGTIVDLGISTRSTKKNPRGIVEIGAGNGQWSRAITDRYNKNNIAEQSTNAVVKKNRRVFDFVLAFDNMSGLPLNPTVYHSKTKPHHDYFYDKVRNCDSIETALKQWHCRGRVLLLVYPSPPTPSDNGTTSDMAYEAIKSYASTSPLNDTVIYVGEGRNGANAGPKFFDYLEGTDGENGENQNKWILQTVLPVQSFGTKGYEKLYVFKKQKSARRQV